MDTKSYQVIFRGKTRSDVDDSAVKGNLSKLFKRDLAAIELLFDGERKVLKRGLDRAMANKYRDVLKKAGAIVAVVAEKTEQTAEVVINRATFSTDDGEVVTDNDHQQSEPDHLTQSNTQTVSSSDEAESEQAMSLAPPGAILMSAVEIDAPVFDNVELTLDDIGMVIDEVDQVEHSDIDTSHMDMTADFDGLDQTPKADALNIETEFNLAEPNKIIDETEKPDRIDIDTGDLNAIDQYDQLDPSKKPPDPEINTDNLGLLD